MERILAIELLLVPDDLDDGSPLYVDAKPWSPAPGWYWYRLGQDYYALNPPHGPHASWEHAIADAVTAFREEMRLN